MSFRYSDGIAAARTMIALEGNPNALQRRLPDGWELAPYSGDDVRGSVLRGANEISLDVTGELADVLGADARVVDGVIQRPYIRQVYVP